MNEHQLKRAQDLKAEGKSYRQIAREIGISLVLVWRALGGQGEEEEEPGGEPPLFESDGQSIDTKPSALIAARIEEAKSRLAEVEPALADVPKEKDRILGSDLFDNTALAQLEGKAATLTREAEYLRQRIVLLEVEKERAECDEAQVRLGELPTLAQGLRDRALNVYLGLANIEAQFVSEFNNLVGLYGEEQELLAEGRFLAVRYRLLRVEGSMERLDDPQGQFEELRQTLLYSLGHAAQRRGTWDAKLRAWENAGRPTTLPRPSHVPPPAPPAPEVFKVMVSGEEEPGMVTVRDINGDGRYFDIRYEPPSRRYPTSWCMADIRACTLRGDLPAWVEQVPPLRKFVEKVRAEKSVSVG